MANIKDLIKSIEAADSSFDEKLAAINQMEETLVSMRAQEEKAVQDNVDLIVEAIKVMERKVENQLEIAKSIVPEKGDKGDKGDRGLDGKNGVDGKDGRDGINGRDGQDGQDGVSVTDAKIDFDGSLIITLSTGQEINVGEVVAPELQEKIKLVTSGGAGTVLPEQAGNANKYLKTSGTTLSWDTLDGSDINLASPPTIGNTTPNTGAFTTLSASSTVSGTGFSTYLASPPAIGGTTPAAGKFTTLESTGTASLGTGSTTYVRAIGDASYPGIFVTGGTNTPLVLQPLGTGALQAQKTDSTATGGNARGANAVDWQTSRTLATQVASGSYSTINGGYSNTNTSFGGIVSGYSNSVAGNYPFIGAGLSNTITGNYGVIAGGYSNSALGYYTVIGGGYANSGTANAAVTTQSGTMNATTAVTLSGSNANIKVGQLITGTSINSFPNTYVAAISGTSLTLSQAASGSSTSTLSFFTPHGVVVGGGNNQATGAYSFIGGGGDAGTAANRNTASGDWSTIAGGWKNTASGEAAFVGGGGSFGGGVSGNTASGTSSFVGAGYGNSAGGYASTTVGGSSNTTGNNYSFIGGGNNNTASAVAASIVGGAYGTVRSIVGMQTIPACSAPIASTQGVSQSSVLVLARQTTDATATVLTSNTSAASGTNQVTLPNNSAYTFRGEVVSGVTGGGDSKSWTIEGLIKRGANAAATTLVGSTVTSMYADVGAATWTIALAADTTNGSLRVTFTGQASTTIRTVARINTVEMTF